MRRLTTGCVLVAAAAAAWCLEAQAPTRAQAVDRSRPGDGALDAPIPAVGAWGGPLRALSDAERGVFLRGREVFDRDFHRSTGLGSPDFNGDSCRACHQEPVLGGAGGLELNVQRAAFDNGGTGPAMLTPGGPAFSRLRLPEMRSREELGAAPDVFEQRQTPVVLGGGLIEAIPEADLLANEDPTDINGDGIRGVARMIDVGGPILVGRFGWKAHVPTLRDFVSDAMGGECGITTPDDGRGFALVSDADAVADPELSAQDASELAQFMALLGAPPRGGGAANPTVQQGEGLFGSIGCATCHVPSFATPEGPANLYSDLLLHQVHPASFRGVGGPDAPSGVYRTPPLWGLRATAPYLHDGRAETIEAAILAHDGEALLVRQAYEALMPSEREALLAFLGDL